VSCEEKEGHELSFVKRPYQEKDEVVESSDHTFQSLGVHAALQTDIALPHCKEYMILGSDDLASSDEDLRDQGAAGRRWGHCRESLELKMTCQVVCEIQLNFEQIVEHRYFCLKEFVFSILRDTRSGGW
jgi:hypothetical protein